MANSVFSALILAGTLGAASLGVSACKAKPSEKKCREAIENVRILTSQTQSDVGADPKAAIRSCRANSSKESVECMINAKTEEDLAKCEGELGEETFEKEREQHEKGMEKTAEKKAKEAEDNGEDEKVEEKTDTPPSETAPEGEAPKAEDTPPAAEEAKAEEPKAEEPKAEEPKAEEPKAAPGADASL